MINQSLIENSIQHSQLSIQNSELINDNFRLVTNFLHSSLLDKLKDFINSVDDSAWHTVLLQEKRPRRSINWIPDSVIEELHIISEQLTADLNHTFNTANTSFQGLQLWHDQGGYKLDPHVDNPIINTSIQIYLFDTSNEYGTSFLLGKDVLDVPFNHNCGYILNKTHNDNRITHWTTTPLPAGINRYSLYLTWGD